MNHLLAKIPALKTFSLLMALALMTAFVPACSHSSHSHGDHGNADDDQGDDDGVMRFPAGFLFGTATAGFQVDMGCPTLTKGECVDSNSDWYRYVTSPKMIESPLTYLSGQDPGVTGPGEWELYQTALDLAAYEATHSG